MNLEEQERWLLREARRDPLYKRNSALILATQDHCYLCGEPVPMWMRLGENRKLYQHEERYPQVDHIIPLVKGGHPFDMGNLGLTHGRCNRIKGPRMLDELEAKEFRWIAEDAEKEKLFKKSKRNILKAIEESGDE